MVLFPYMKKQVYEISYSLKKERNAKNLRIFLYIIITFTVINLLLQFVFFPVKQRSISMQPDIQKDSCVLVTPISTKPKRGQLFVLNPRSKQNNSFIIKVTDKFVGFFTLQKIKPFTSIANMSSMSELRRVAALPGDTIYMKDYILYVKPANESFFYTEFELTNVKYNIDVVLPPTDWDRSMGISGSFPEIKLGADEYFVLSDNRLSSMDSRLWGPIPRSSILAKAFFVYYPFNKMRLF